MRKILVVLLICLLALPVGLSARKKYRGKSSKYKNAVTTYTITADDHSHSYTHHYVDDVYYHGHMHMEFEDNSLFLFNAYSEDEVEITDDLSVIINGDDIEINSDQRSAVKKFYTHAQRLSELSDEIDVYAEDFDDYEHLVKAQIARAAYENAVAIYAGEYYSDDDEFEDLEEMMEELDEKLDEMDRRLEKKDRELDDAVERLEDKAKEVEEEAELMEEAFDDMLDEIPELDDIDWD